MNLLPIADAATTRRLTWRLLTRRPWAPAGVAALFVIAAACGLAAPALLGVIVSTVDSDGPAGTIVAAAVGILGAGALAAFLTAYAQAAMARLLQNALADLREDVFATTLRIPQASIERAGVGDVLSRVSGDVEAVGEAVSGVLPAFTSAAFTIILTVTGLGVIDWRFAVAAALAAPIQVLGLRWFLGKSGPMYRRVRIAEGERTGQLVEAFEGAGTITSLGRGERHSARVASASREAVELSMGATKVMARFWNRVNTAEFVGLASVLAVGYWLTSSGLAGIGMATAAALLFFRLFDPIGTVLAEFDELQKAFAGLSRLFGVLQHKGDPEVDGGWTGSAGRLEVRNVSFSYTPGRLVLDDVSLTVAPGERVAVVGASGSGKSTLAALIAGIHPPGEGRVLLDGEPVETGRAAASGVMLVTQEVRTFSGTVADNLRLASPKADDAALDAAVRAVGADWVGELSEGLATVVGEHGVALTGEQAQQLALARVALAGPRLAILDEATAETGARAAKRLDRATAEAVGGASALIIAHRLTQAAAADRVIVMEAGRIVESGAHDELTRAGGPYARLWEAWTRHARGTAVTSGGSGTG
ncbi:ABC transporter ATP-binding protein [Phytomonospora endophytica]|uniref:ATP-binding cassette subfamily C protein n=1 Tax=Phytomonospora endophytica TaxID=714109 RepID=A0A841FNF9_9ACTN|nr:ABC transporter ATP-binding protein [Phytomonospora endophytica]MBB6034757.1 ATP-binding cassette subfamily C protein [Phytomonospora endophytica]GIG69040.1 multidrug ABC transporter permease [Phytomonospora endophytica]